MVFVLIVLCMHYLVFPRLWPWTDVQNSAYRVWICPTLENHGWWVEPRNTHYSRAQFSDRTWTGPEPYCLPGSDNPNRDYLCYSNVISRYERPTNMECFLEQTSIKSPMLLKWFRPLSSTHRRPAVSELSGLNHLSNIGDFIDVSSRKHSMFVGPSYLEIIPICGAGS